MSNKTQLQTNNIQLQTLIGEVNSAIDIASSLPEYEPSTTEIWELTLEDGSVVTKEMVVAT